jgi:hypothetical protein
MSAIVLAKTIEEATQRPTAPPPGAVPVHAAVAALMAHGVEPTLEIGWREAAVTLTARCGPIAIPLAFDAPTMRKIIANLEQAIAAASPSPVPALVPDAGPDHPGLPFQFRPELVQVRDNPYDKYDPERDDAEAMRLGRPPFCPAEAVADSPADDSLDMIAPGLRLAVCEP